MLTLYTQPGCMYSARVNEVIEELGLSVEEKNIADHAIAEELLQRGGKLQTPYLVDDEFDVEMFESEKIIDHLQEQYGTHTS